MICSLFSRLFSVGRRSLCFGGYDLCRLSWLSVNSHCCNSSCAFEEWKCDPVAVASKYLTSAEADCLFRGKPAYLKCRQCINSKTYLLFGISCVGEVIFELSSNGAGIFNVRRVAYICK